MKLKQAREIARIDPNYRLKCFWFIPQDSIKKDEIGKKKFSWVLEYKDNHEAKWKALVGKGQNFGLGLFSEEIWPKGKQ